MIKITITEDSEQDLQLLQMLLDTCEDIEIIGVATTGKKALQLVKKLQPDVALFDIGLPDMSGVECVKQLSPVCRNTEFVMCTVFDEDALVYESLCVGASSYLLKNSADELIIQTIKEVHEGASPMSGDIARKVINLLQQKMPQSNFGITKREKEILEELGKGNSYKEIADNLHISIKTLKYHIYQIYGKLQVNNRVKAVNKYFNR